MRIEAIKIQAAALYERYSGLPIQETLREEALVVYVMKILSALETAITNATLEDFLIRNWALVNGTALSPTVIPDVDITKLLCDVAMFLTDEKNEQHPDESITALQLLMPTVTIESIREEYQSLNEIPLSTVLKTHILGRKGQFLLPVKLLTELDLSPEAIHLNNPYTPMMTEDATLYQVAPEEYARLVGHSPLTQAVGDAKQQYDLLANDKSTLLGQLSELCSKLGIYSVTGLGTETHAAAGAYAPIIVFNDYYNQLDETQKGAIPAPLKNEIDKLLNLSSNPEANINATENIETCIATRRWKLMEHTRGHEATLNAIAVGGARKESLIYETTARLKAAIDALDEALEIKIHAGGHDNLGLNRRLLEELGLIFSISSSEDLDIFKAFSADEMSEFLVNPALAAQLIDVIDNLENLVIFILDLSLEKTDAFFSHTQEAMVKRLITSPPNLSALLISLDFEKCTAICHAMKSELPKIIKKGESFRIVLQHLTPEQRTAVYDAMKGDLPKIIKTVVDLSNVLQYLTPEQCTAMIDILKNEWPKIVTSMEGFRYIERYLTMDQRLAIIDAMGSKILGIKHIYDQPRRTSSDDLNNIIAFIKTPTNTATAKLFAASMIDNDIEKIKTNFMGLAQETKSWRAKGYSFWSREDPLDTLIKRIHALAPKWKDRIQSTFGLSNELSKETICCLLRQHAASEGSSHSPDFKFWRISNQLDHK